MLVYILPKSAFPELHSDTIFGAMLYAMSQLGIDISTLLRQFEKSPPFLVSSAFPFTYSNGAKIRFFPKPIVEPSKAEFDAVKEFKKVKYIQEDIFKTWITGETNEGKMQEALENKKYTILAGEFLVEKDSKMDFKIKSIILPRNTINRVTQASENIFYTQLYNFEKAGLFFGIKFYDENYRSDVIATLRFLRDRGFGEDVSVGKGHFGFDDDDFKITDETIANNAGERFITLSRYIPGEELRAFNKEQMWYEIYSKRSRSSDGRLRKQVRFFVEGSTFPEIGKEYYGRIIHSADDAVEYGYAYKIRIKGS